jgi:hypothetical protein
MKRPDRLAGMSEDQRRDYLQAFRGRPATDPDVARTVVLTARRQKRVMSIMMAVFVGTIAFGVWVFIDNGGVLLLSLGVFALLYSTYFWIIAHRAVRLNEPVVGRSRPAPS